MATRARLDFKPIDYAYQARYGIMPDYDFTNRLRAGQPREEVDALVNGRLAEIWKQLKYEHEHREELAWQEPGIDCPF